VSRWSARRSGRWIDEYQRRARQLHRCTYSRTAL
jgi:hypothetical protein